MNRLDAPAAKVIGALKVIFSPEYIKSYYTRVNLGVVETCEREYIASLMGISKKFHIGH
ncbi:MAG: hypothetical protein NWE97_00340 [Candidatus Bathyarchaeota archaeon]|nr:hypothetical protein [Candidatus Bathyarchaeota archaeon]